MMLPLHGIRRGPRLVRMGKPARALLLTAQRDSRNFSRVGIWRENLVTPSFENPGSLPFSWPKDASDGARQQRAEGQIGTHRDIVTTQTRPSVRASKGSPHVRVPLSQEFRQVLGLRNLYYTTPLIYDNRTPSTHNVEEAIKRRTVEEFDKTCRHSGQQGLSALAVGTAHLQQILPPNLFLKMKIGTRKKKTLLSIEASGQHTLPFIRLSLGSMHVPKVQARGALTSDETPFRFTAVLHATAHSQPQSKTSITSTLLPGKEEISFLRSTCNMVLSRLCSDMQFETPLAACRNFAEALLRVLRFRTPYIILTSVKLLAEAMGGGGNEYLVQATWRDSIDVVTSVAETKKRQVDVAVIKDGVAGQDDAGIAPQSDQDEFEVADSNVPLKSAEPSSWSREILQSTKRWCHLDSGASEKVVSVLDPQRIPLDAAKRRFGTPFVNFKIDWCPESISSLADLDFITILNAIEAALEAAGDSSVASLVCAVESVAKKLPHVHRLQVDLRSHAESIYQCSTARPTVARTLFKVSTVMPDTPNASSSFLVCLPSMALSATVQPKLDSSSFEMLDIDSSSVWSPADLGHWLKEDINDVAKELYARHYEIASSIVAKNHFASRYEVVSTVAKVAKSSATILRLAKTIRISASSPPKTGVLHAKTSATATATSHVDAFIALGSNVGDRLDAIEQACVALEKDHTIRILETSPLYETKAMYVEDQESFLNGVCKIQTDLSPMQLLDHLQAIEHDLGRVKIIDKGPRNIDLDILTYGWDVIRSDRLTVPHPLMHEREFVLRPLSDTSGASLAVVRLSPRKWQTSLQWLHELSPLEPPMYAMTPLSPGSDSLRPLKPQRRTTVMSILNVTPDSFSDGGDNLSSDMEALRQTVATHIADGATIIDIGGQSSRPNAPDITADEEISRILPAIEAIKSLPEASNITISVDTYRASVAEAAIKAGAHIINDISAGTLDSEMLPTIARLRCTYIMMHMRGTPATMQSEENTSYPNGLIRTIASELQSRLQAAQEAGIRRWRIILDPGIGFAKTTEQNAELLGNFSELRNWSGLATYPWVVGSSRKTFIGNLTGVAEAKERVEGTAATVTAAVAGGAEIVRVHDVKEMGRVVKMADAMYRSG